jgi:cytochrome P450
VVHPREDLYPEPDRFRPERFLEGKAESYTWLPFGGGIRRCIGAALAQVEMAEVIRAVVSGVDLEPVRAEPDPVVMRGITLVPRHGTPVAVARVRRPVRPAPSPPSATRAVAASPAHPTPRHSSSC